MDTILEQILDLDMLSGREGGGSLDECTQTEAPHYYVGGLGMTTWEWLRTPGDSVHIPATMAKGTWVADGVFVPLASFFMCETRCLRIV